MQISRSTSVAAVLMAVCWTAGIAVAAEPISIDDLQRKEEISFEQEILPILQKNCLACHSASEKQGNLVLESPSGMLTGGDTGASVVPGRGSESLILMLASHQDEPVMPPEGNDVAAQNLSPAELGLLKLWIDQGAKGSAGIDSLSPKQWQPLPPGVHPVQAIALTEDGQFVACSRANQIFLYHVPTGQLVTKLSDESLDSEHATGIAHRDLVQSLAFNVDGDLLASGGFREVKLWRRPRDVTRFHLAMESAATAVAVSPDKQWIAVADQGSLIRLFDTSAGKPGPALSGHTDVIRSLRFTGDGKQLVSGSVDRTVRLWNVADGQPQGILETPAAVNAIELVDHESPNEQTPAPPQLLVTGHDDKAVRVWELPDAKPQPLASSLADVTKTATSRDGRLLAILDNQNAIRVLSLERSGDQPLGAEIATWTVEQEVTSFAFSALSDAPTEAAQHALLTGSSDGSFRMWSLPEHELMRQWSPEAKPVTSLAASADGSIAATGRDDGSIALWNLTAGEEEPTAVRTLEGNKQAITDMWFHSGGQTLFTAAADGSLRGYNTENGQQIFATSHGAMIHDLALSPSEQVIATAGENATVRLWQTNGAAYGPGQITSLSGPAHAVVFSPDSKLIVIGIAGENAGAQLHDLASGSLRQRMTHRANRTVGLATIVNADATTDANELGWLIASSSGLHAWKSHWIRDITGHSQGVTSLAADPDRQRHVYSASLDGSIRRWNLDTGQLVRQFNHGGPVNAVAVSPDGQRLASASENGRARLFRVTNGQQIAEMRGDVRTKVRLTRAQQLLSSTNARLNIAKRLVDEAEKDVPKKTEAEKKLADALTAANKAVSENQEAVDKALADKIAAEKAAIEASTAAKNAFAEKQQAELLASNAAAAMEVAQRRMNQLQQALSNNPENGALKQLVADAQQDLATCQQESQQFSAAVKAPSEKAQQMANQANTAAQKVNDVQKPYNDATSKLKKAQAEQNLLSQQRALAAKELIEAKDLVPRRKEALERAETSKTEAEKSVASDNEAVQAAEKPLHCVAFSPDGNTLATAGIFASVHTWDGQTGEAIAALAGHSGPTHQVVFLDAGTIASVSEDQSCRIWELNPQWMLERTIGSKDEPDIIAHRATAVDFNRDSTQLLLASGVPSRGGQLHVFGIADGQRVLYLPRAHDDVVYAARFSPDGKRIASVGADKYLRTFDVITGSQLRRFEGHTNYVLGVSWKSDGETIATSSADHTIKLWESETGDQRRTITQQLTKHITAVHFIGDTNNLISSSGDRRVRIHNGNNGGIARTFSEVKSWLHCVAVTPDNKIVAAGDANGTVTIWNAANGQLLHSLTAE